MRPPWDEAYWRNFEAETCRRILHSGSDLIAWQFAARRSRAILRVYSTSFFLVTRFLPPAKRAEVEVIYAAVRFPDEVVDSFPLRPEDQHAYLDLWAGAYNRSLAMQSVRERVASGVPSVVAAFAQVVRDREIPPEHYHAFLAAMRNDIAPRPYRDMDDLVESYIYGSATVVGYFLAYVYGPSAPANFERALRSSRDLAIALQLTNFLRDVGEDQRRGRVYLPLDLLQDQGISKLDVNDSAQLAGLRTVLRSVSATAENHYALAESTLDAFAPDCRVAIRACIDVYRQLNLRIGRSMEGVRHRESVPMSVKFQVLPGSKYWRLPLAWAGVL